MKSCPACNLRYADEVSFCAKDGTPVVVDAAAAAAAEAASAMVGQVIGDRYRLVRKLGEGGMGEVYEAEHIHIEKRVALKLLRAEILGNQEAVTRFRQEARSASSIGHENIIQIDDFGTLSDGRVYLAMEFLSGQPFDKMIEKPLPIPRALAILIQACRGLAAAHAKGIIHRDMKPENIYVTTTRDGREVPKILDFGIAKVAGGDDSNHLTRTGTIFGTPFYMAPEQALGQHIDHRADIYAMGVILYETFAGTVPFKGESFMGILTQHITVPPIPPSQPAMAAGRDVPEPLEAVIMKALEKDPASRFASMNELTAALVDVYRQLVGAGMTAPLAAQPAPVSQFMPVPTTAMVSQSGRVTVGPVTVAKARSPWSWIAVGLGVVAVAGAGAYVLLARNGDEGVVAQAPAASAQPPAQPAIPEPAKAAVAGAPAVAATVLVESIPPGAQILEGDERLGEAALNVKVRQGEPLRLTLHLAGYHDKMVTVDGQGEKVTVTLEKEVGVRPRVEPAAPPPSPVTTVAPPPPPVRQEPPAKPPKRPKTQGLIEDKDELL